MPESPKNSNPGFQSHAHARPARDSSPDTTAVPKADGRRPGDTRRAGQLTTMPLRTGRHPTGSQRDYVLV
jgi:hypothetical protein